LYKSYFEEGQPPASLETLLKAAREGSLNEVEVRQFLESGEDRMTVKNAIRRVNGDIDGVPHIVICGLYSQSDADYQEGSGISQFLGQLRRSSI
jgi:predicted DsbA family dithiol-disulfide isomerase